MNVVEITGYAASTMVALSLTMKNIVSLRVLNLIGCSLFAIYGVIVTVTNSFITCINVYYLWKIQRNGIHNL
ncbi:hypothetical protein [Vibrio jasicida]|uniref:hypothetical protein n=1 Tax=Vibrio jasicida TaxID=766224 RepID=UPI0009E4A035|nr:hypothetical protein [Vibrio jasicida]